MDITKFLLKEMPFDKIFVKCFYAGSIIGLIVGAIVAYKVAQGM